jgi:hypothetical protein
MKVLVSSFIVLAAILHSCDPNNISIDAPACIEDLIRKDPQPKEVWRYTYQGETVFLVVPDCCDQYISVYSSKCVLICSPGGGITGKGDGKCPDFYQEAEEGLLLWKAE